MQKRHLALLRVFFGVSDAFLLNMCLFFSDHIFNHHVHNNIQYYVIAFLVNIVLWILSTSPFRLYGEYTIYKLRDIYGATWRSILLYTVLFQLYLFFSNDFAFHFSTKVVFAYYSIIAVTFL